MSASPAATKKGEPAMKVLPSAPAGMSSGVISAATISSRVWCAAGSTGQEPYSLAMCLKEMSAAIAGWRIEILATDDFEVEDVRRLYEEFDFQPVKKIPRQRRILVHPLGRLPTVGRIPLACPAGTREIRAEVETDNAKAADLEYGITLSAEALPVPEGKRPGEFVFSGPADWVVVPPKTPGVLVIELDEPFYTSVVFNPDDTAENLRKYGGNLPGIRPGRRTAEYIDYVLTRLTLIGDFAPKPLPVS